MIFEKNVGGLYLLTISGPVARPPNNELNRTGPEPVSALNFLLGENISYSPRLIAICLSSSQNSLQLIRPYKSPLPAVICLFKHSGTPSSE